MALYSISLTKVWDSPKSKNMGKIKPPKIKYEYEEDRVAIDDVYDYIFEKLLREALVE